MHLRWGGTDNGLWTHIFLKLYLFFHLTYTVCIIYKKLFSCSNSNILLDGKTFMYHTFYINTKPKCNAMELAPKKISIFIYLYMIKSFIFDFMVFQVLIIRNWPLFNVFLTCLVSYSKSYNLKTLTVHYKCFLCVFNSEELDKFMESQGASAPGILALTTSLSKPFMRLDKYPTLLQELERHVEVQEKINSIVYIYSICRTMYLISFDL